MWIVVTGNPVYGFSHYGPFKNKEEALDWMLDLDEQGWVSELNEV